MHEQQVNSVTDLQEAVHRGTRLMPRGGGSKTALSVTTAATTEDAAPGITVLDLRGLSGILEYQPEEYTFTARAGTPLAEVEAALAGHGQYLPFEPPLVEQGATLGGTVATGLSGSGRYRYGGVRDFLIGVRFVDGRGEIVRGGGKVVKNAAGFDLPKLMVGSLGRFGILTEVSFKVFPQPQAYATLRIPYADLAAAIDAIHTLSAAPFDIEALDLAPAAADQETDATLWIRIGGLESVLEERTTHLRTFLGGGEIHTDADEAALWRDARAFAWQPADTALVKVPTTTHKILDLEHALAGTDAVRRYAVGGNLGWIAWSGDVDELHRLLNEREMAGLVVMGPGRRQFLGVRRGDAFARRIKQALDPENKFLEL